MALATFTVDRIIRKVPHGLSQAGTRRPRGTLPRRLDVELPSPDNVGKQYSILTESRMLRFAAACTLIVTVAACSARNLDRAPARRGGACAFRVCIKALPGSESLVYTARNQAPVPATVGIHFERLRNLESTDPDTVIRTVSAGQSEVLTRLWIVDPQEDVGIRPVVTIDLGSDSTVHRPPRPYSLPFGGEEPRELISGFGGPTHLEANHYSFDFGMPEGTPILAARRGVVVYVQDGFRRGGLTPDLIERANLLVVGHDDGTLASYGHLREGLRVEVGDTVHRGELLGWSGSTGFSGRPHLHFHVGKRMMGGAFRTIPIRFEPAERGRATPDGNVVAAPEAEAEVGAVPEIGEGPEASEEGERSGRWATEISNLREGGSYGPGIEWDGSEP